MDSLFLVTVFGLLLVPSGLAILALPPVDMDAVPPYLSEFYNNRSIAFYQYIANTTHDNIALSVSDSVTFALHLYLLNNQSIVRNEWLEKFFEFFDDDESTLEDLEDIAPLVKSEIVIDGKAGNGLILAMRYDCNKYHTIHHTVPTNGIFHGLIAYSKLSNGVRLMKEWYSFFGIEIEIDEKDFEGRECITALGADVFRHDWQTSDICVHRAKFFQSWDTYQSGVKYTRVIGEFLGYGELPELNARYLEVPWNNTYVQQDGGIDAKRLFIILPNILNGLHEMETKVTYQTIVKMLSEAKKSQVVAILPEISVTRKYQFSPIIGNVRSEPHDDFPGIENLPRAADAITVTRFEAFPAAAKECPSNTEPEGVIQVSGIPYFNANHPFLAVVVGRSDDADDWIMNYMVRYREAEQRQN